MKPIFMYGHESLVKYHLKKISEYYSFDANKYQNFIIIA